MKREILPVKVDKSHIITIGEKLYSQSVELVRELINNAYDADATKVKVTITKDRIVIEDNGTGMDREGLIQYFNIGSPLKKIEPKSPKFRRERIGEFGIGKFAALTAGGRFEVYTQKGDFAAKVVFDKKKWERKKRWDLPLEMMKPKPERGDGTTVTITKLTKVFNPDEVAEWIRERIPLGVSNFNVYVNGYKLLPKRFSGYRIPVFEGTPYGIVHGEIVILPMSQANPNDMGIEVKVKQVMITKELFGMETWGKDSARVKGEVNANFLPIASDRSGFIIDSPEYQTFTKIMDSIMKQVEKALMRVKGERARRITKRALKEALERIERALGGNPEFAPPNIVAEGIKGGIGEVGEIKEERLEENKSDYDEEREISSEGEEDSENPPGLKHPIQKPKVRRINPRAIIQKIKVKGKGVNCCIDHFGSDGPEVFTEGNVIYINQDHPLYQRESKKKVTFVMHIARLLSQEISLMSLPENPRKAFENQSHLLRDAFKD